MQILSWLITYTTITQTKHIYIILCVQRASEKRLTLREISYNFRGKRRHIENKFGL